MKKRSIFLPLLICLAAAFFACGIFAVSNTKDRGQTVTAEAATAVTQTIYWRYTSGSTTLELSSAQLTGGTARGSFAGTAEFSNTTVPWASYFAKLTTVKILTEIAPKSIAYWFYCCRELQTINYFSNLDVSQVTNMNSSFYNCAGLTMLDVSKWDTSNLTNMSNLFCGCNSVTSLDVSKWDTSNVTNMSSVFGNCFLLTSFDISKWDTSNVTNMGTMFVGCRALTTLDLSMWDTSNVTEIVALLAGCTSLKSVDLSCFDGSQVGSLSNFFNQITTLEKIKLSKSLAEKFAQSTDDTKMPLPLYYADGTEITDVSQLTEGGGYFTSPHTHDYQFTSSTATCTDAGEELYTCSEPFCGLTKTESADALGHITTKVEAVSVTCTTNGRHEHYVCSRCNQLSWDNEGNSPCTASDVVINQLQHDIKDTVTAPTCLTGGSTKHTCQREGCGYEYTDSYTDALGHDWNDWHTTKQATEDEAGEEQRECQRTNCDEVEMQPIPQLNHTHKFAEGWTSDETKHWHASTCGHSVKDGEAAHSWNDGEITTDPSCTAEGVKTFTCTVCNKTRTETIDKIAHTPGDAANCTTAQTCTVCGFELAAKLGHNYEAAEGGVAPTCTTAGSGKVVCTRCNDEQVGASIPALGHNPGTAATCTEPQTCTVCNTELAAAMGHTPAVDEAKAPTCTETGLTAGTHCSVCNEVITAQEEVPALGHNYEWVITQEATVEESGLMENICAVCGDKDGEEEIAKLVDPNGEIDLPVDINVEFKVTQSSTDNDYSDIEKGLKRGYWAQLWYRNDDGTLGDEFTDTINCFLTLKIPTEIIEAIRGGEEINRDKIAAGLKVYYIDGEGTPVEVDNFTIAMRDDDSWQIKFNYNEKFRAEVVFAADLEEQPAEPESSGIPWWVWLIVGLVVVAIVGVVIVIIVVAKKKNNDGNGGDTEELKAQLAEQSEKIDELLGRDDGGFNTPVELDENGNVIFK